MTTWEHIEDQLKHRVFGNLKSLELVDSKVIKEKEIKK